MSVRIWMILSTANEVGGLEAQVLELARDQIARGNQVVVSFASTEATQEYAGSFREIGAEYRPLITGEFSSLGPKLGWALGFILTLYRSIQIARDVTMLHLPHAFGTFGPLLACSLLNRPTLVVFHCSPPEIAGHNLVRRLYRWMSSRRQKWIALSDFARRALVGLFDLPSERVFRIYNGIVARELPPRSDARKQLRLREPTVMILCLARLTHGKGHDELLRAAEGFLGERSPARLFLAGDGPLGSEVRALHAHSPVYQRIDILGHREDVATLLAAADIFVTASHSEGFSLAILEAMHAGLPIVAYRVTSLPEMILHEKTGFLVERGDTKSFAHAVRTLAQSSALRKSMGREAIKVAQSFSPKGMLDRYDRLIADAAE